MPNKETYITCDCDAGNCDCSCDCMTHRGMDEDAAIDAAEIFSQLASPARVRLLSLLVQGEMCVCHMAERLGMSQPAVSHHLKSLRQCGVVRFQKYGKRAVYSLSDSDAGAAVRRILCDLQTDNEVHV